MLLTMLLLSLMIILPRLLGWKDAFSRSDSNIFLICVHLRHLRPILQFKRGEYLHPIEIIQQRTFFIEKYQWDRLSAY